MNRLPSGVFFSGIVTTVPAQLVSHYRILRPLGSGGMGTVYLAEDTTLHRTVALKFVSEKTARSLKVNDRLKREARTASALSHPNICTIFEFGEDGGEVFIAMEYVEGRTFADVIRTGTLPVDTVLRYGRQIASGLAYAHNHGVLHGDLTSKNILITSAGDAKILDFGLARWNDDAEFDQQTLETISAESRPGLAGTLPYMAPEQIEGAVASARTDIWSLGIVLYEGATGQRPFKGDNLHLLCNAILQDSPKPLPARFPSGLATIVSRCLEKEPARRYQRASEALASLETLTSANQGVQSESLQRRAFRIRTVLGVLIPVLLVFAGAFSVRSGKLWRRHGEVHSPVLLGVIPPVSSADTAQTAFDSGLVDTLNSRLGELSARHQLVVIPMSSILEKQVRTVDAARQEFGVNLVLILKVQRSADDVRVNYALVDTQSNQQVRSGTITAKASDPFALQDRVFESVATAMELQLAPQEKQFLTSHGTVEPAAYDYYIQGRGYLQDYVVAEKVDSAIAVFSRALERDPAYAEATAGLGEAYWRKFQLTHEGKWADEAIANCQKAVALGPNLASAHSCLGQVFTARGDYKQASEQYSRAVEIEPGNDDALSGLAAAFEQLGRPEDAEKLYKQAVAARPSYWATYNWLGLFYMNHARYEEAFGMFSQVVSLVPDSFTGYYNLGAVRILQGKYGEAIPLLERSLSIRQTADALSNLGTALFQMRRYSESATKFEEAVKLDDKNYIMWGNLGDAYYWAGKRSDSAVAYSTAIALGEEQLRRNPNDATLRGCLGEYHAMKGEQKSALENVEASLRLQPNGANLLFNAGVVYEQIGETDRALDALNRAVSLGITPEMLRDTPNFDPLIDNPRFVELTRSAHKN